MKYFSNQFAKYFLWVTLLTLPLWVINGLFKLNFLPDSLPITDIFATFVPAVVGIIFVFREKKQDGVQKYLLRTFDFKRIQSLPSTLLLTLFMPLVYVITYFLMLKFDISLPTAYTFPLLAPIFLLVYFIAAAGEELGYMAYLYEREEKNENRLCAAVFIGIYWAIWHLPSMIQIGQSPKLILFGLMATIGYRIIYIYIYHLVNRSVFAIILLHAIGNTCRTIFPGGRSSFEKMDGVVGYSLVIFLSFIAALMIRNRKIQGR